ncbi:MAG: TIGR03016 family PEP-CTERM system-associated outer membrane protein [Alphaproteobacteria bacterium]
MSIAGFGALTGLIVALAAKPGAAADWDVTPAVSLTSIFSDNAYVNAEGAEQSDVITTVAPGVSVRGTGGRVQANFDYALQRVHYLNDNDRGEFRQELVGNGAAEIYEDQVFVDARASVSRQIVSSAGPVTGTEFDDSTNVTEVRNFEISPAFRHHFGNWVDTIARNRFSQVTTDSTTVTNTSTVGSEFSASSGSRFSVFTWTLSLTDDKTIRDGDAPRIKTRFINADGRYAVNRKISLLGGVGHEEIDDPTLTTEPNGVTWNIGAALRPGPKTDVTVTYGQRFDSENWAADAVYRISSRTQLSASYQESIQISQQAINEDLSFLGVDDQGNLIDTRTGMPFEFESASFGLTSDAFRSKSLNAAFTATRRRQSFSLDGGWQSQKTDSTGIEQTVLSAGGSWNRSLNPRANATAAFTFRHTDFGTPDGRKDNFYVASLSYNHVISETVSGSLSYIHTERTSNVSGNGQSDNVITLSLSKSF